MVYYPVMAREYHPFYDEKGRLQCNYVTYKVCYGSQEEAWLHAARIFAEDGDILVPYQCGRKVFRVAKIRIKKNNNPWSWINRYIHYVWKHKSSSGNSPGCEYWHLTHSHEHLLNP